MPDVIVIDLPLPDKRLQVNKPGRDLHWAERGRIVKATRQLAGYTAKPSAPKKPWSRATLHATFYVQQIRKRDDDNLNRWIKAYRDGLADAGIVKDDNHFTLRAPAVVIDPKQQPRVVLRIERTE
jgi:Holliday junction resolvase RusA-like endonuclease